MSESLIRAQIKAILQTVAGIGAVHDYERLSLSLTAYLDLMTSGGKVNGWTIHRESTESIRETMAQITRTHTYRLGGIYAVDDAAGSEDTFQGILDAIFDAFKVKPNLNGTAQRSEPLQIESVDVTELGGRAFHTAEMTLLVIERVNE